MKKALSVREITYIASGTALIAAGSWISVPSLLPSMAPFTMQTFAVCTAAGLLGRRPGTWSVLCYILLGAVGAPVFALFRGGADVLLGPTGGYIAGFVFTALTTGYAADRWGERLGVIVPAMALGVLLCYTFGTVWFMSVYTRDGGGLSVLTALSWCVFPYLVPDGIKIVLAALLVRRLRGFVQKGLRK